MKRRRPKLRWEDEVDNDVKAVEETNWKNPDMNRQIWQNHLRKDRDKKKRLFCQ
jgi:hypothetical protein